MTTPAEPAAPPAAPAAPAAPAPSATPAAGWDDVFAGMTPAEVKAALDDSRKWEGRAKANKAKADQLDQLTASQQSAEEKAAAAAARADRLAGQFVTAELKAALTGIVPDAAAVVGTLNHALYVTADGEIDADKVAALQATYRALAVPSGPRAPAPNPAQGNGTRQLTLTEMVAELERKPGRSREEQRELGRLKARQLAQIRQGQA